MCSLNGLNIATTPRPICHLCGRPGEYFYRNLEEHVFGTKEAWHFKRCPNPECGLVWLDPSPTMAYLNEMYQRYYGENPKPEGLTSNCPSLTRKLHGAALEGYLPLRSDGSAGVPLWSKLLGFLLKLRSAMDWSYVNLRSPTGGTLLDVGCGSGELLALLKSLGWEVEGLDIDPVAVQNAVAKGLRVRWGNLADQAYPTAHFDVIMMNHVLEHLHEPVDLLLKCHRILKPRGRLIIVTPNLESWGHRIFKKSWIGLGIPSHLYLYTSQSLRVVVEKAGFKVSSLVTTAKSALWFFHASRAIVLQQKDLLQLKPSILQRFFALGFAALEWPLTKLNFSLGEELALEAVKSPPDN